MGKVDIFIHKEPGYGYWAEIPAMPGCFTDGATLAEVRRNILEAAQCWLGMEIKLALFESPKIDFIMLSCSRLFLFGIVLGKSFQ